jgi:hypothetical protein
MADPLSITSGVIAMPQAAKAVISYFADVDEADDCDDDCDGPSLNASAGGLR